MLTLSEIVLENDPDCVSDVVDELLYDMQKIYDESESGHLRLAIHEMLLNAIEHGNLEISSHEKRYAIETDRYDQLLKDRRNDPKYATRRVHVNVTQDREQGVYKCCIRDEGKGFHWKEWITADQSSEDAWVAACGRGIALTRGVAETVDYNDLGNEVTLTVRLHSVVASDATAQTES